MKKVLLIATGGTIASSDEGDGLTPHYNVDDLIENVPEIKKLCHLSGKLIMNIDSTNMNPELWSLIAQAIHDHYNDYDAFVVTHGTDTMAYTSAALAYMLKNLQKPVVVTGSQYSIEAFGTDAKQNLTDAIRFAVQDVVGVFIAFDGKIINGTRAMKVKTKSLDAFKSVNYPYVANIKHGRISFNDDVYAHIQKNHLDTENYAIFADKKFILANTLCTDVFVLKLFPGINPKIFDFIKDEYKGVIIESFGIGGIPFENFDIATKVKELINSGVAVVVTTQCLEEGVDLNIYEVGKKLAKTKIIYAKDMNTEAIVAKLIWALGQAENYDEVKSLFETPVMGDIGYIKNIL